jgi:hypothetical protein
LTKKEILFFWRCSVYPKDFVVFNLILYCRHAVCYVILIHSVSNP